jgi:hypothetical protein
VLPFFHIALDRDRHHWVFVAGWGAGVITKYIILCAVSFTIIVWLYEFIIKNISDLALRIRDKIIEP